MYKRIIKNSAIYGILPQLPKVASFFVLPFITPYLSGIDYGIVGILYAYIGAFSIFHLLGLNLIVVNAFYHHPKQYKWYWRQIYGFVWIWSLIYFVFLGIVIYNALPEEAYENRWWIISMKIIPLLLFSPSDMLAGAYYRLNQQAFPVAMRSLFAGILAIALNYYLIANMKLGYMGWITSEFVSSIVSGILFFWPVYFKWKLYPIFNFKWRLIKKALKVSLPVLPHSYSGYLLNSSDRLIMDKLNVPTKEIGLYSLAYNFGNYIEVVTNAINQAVSPNLLESLKNRRWLEFKKIIFAFESLVLFGCFSCSLWVPQWLPLLIKNRELLSIQYLLVIIIMGYSYRPMYIAFNSIIFFHQETKILWKISFVAGLISVFSNLILIPFYGIFAAAINTFVSLLYMGFVGYLFKKYKDLAKINLNPFLWLSLIISTSAIVLLCLNLNVYYKIIINISLVFLLFLINYLGNKTKNVF